MTDQYAVIGNPVAHSKSPRIHAEFARQMGEDIAYRAIHCAVPDFEIEVRRFREIGGCGLNVTLPFKHRAYALAQQRTERAEQANAVNTLGFADKAISGDNTDGIGLVRDLTANLGCTVRGHRVLLMGAGGAAYGVCGSLLEQNPSALTIANRTRDKADALRGRFASSKGSVRLDTASYDELSGRLFDVVINATSAGLLDAMPPLPVTVFASGALAYDMVYGKKTPFLAYAERAGARVSDGLGMLVEQAAESFYVWRGKRPLTAPVIALLRSGEP